MYFLVARLREPHDGLFTGQIDAVDTVNYSYRVTFDRPGLFQFTINSLLLDTSMRWTPAVFNHFTVVTKRAVPQVSILDSWLNLKLEQLVTMIFCSVSL